LWFYWQGRFEPFCKARIGYGGKVGWKKNTLKSKQMKKRIGNGSNREEVSGW